MVLKRGRFGAFLACSGYPECKTTRKIVVGKEGKAEAKPEVLLDEPCPKCGSKLAIKQGRFGEFTSCSNYPKCRYIKMKENRRGLSGMRQGNIVERKSKRGKLFFGCDRYPIAASSCGTARGQGVSRLQVALSRREGHEEGRTAPSVRAGRVRLRRAGRRSARDGLSYFQGGGEAALTL
jgi:ssDNA-binding Zn-finger/Zn-ribbon topoisomerase 1